MTTIAEKLTLLNSTKQAIKTAIEDKGVTVGTAPFSDYAAKIVGIGAGTQWVRPSDWLTLQTVTATDNKFVGLHAVYPDANFVALSAAGDYTVDWGDGTVENFASGATAQHEYNYATYDVANTTLCSRGYKQAIVTVTPQAGQTFSELNLHKLHSSLTVSYSSGFLDIALAGANLIDLRIGQQAPGNVTPLIRFADLEQVNLVKTNLRQCNGLFYACYSLSNVVDVSTSSDAPVTGSCTFTDGGDLVTFAGHGRRNGDGVIFTSIVSTTGITVDTSYFVVNATSDTFQVSTTYGGAAQQLTTDGTGTAVFGTHFNYMFNGCRSLQSIPLLNTAAGTSFNNMFSNCYSLQSVPPLNTAAGASFSYMFSSCYSLQSIPLLNTAAGTSFSNMFSNCFSLQSIPLLNTAAGTNFTLMFSGCYSLQSIPPLNTAAGTSFSNMFSNCYSLQSIPLLNTAAGTSFSSMFGGCYSLQSIPPLNTAAGTSFSSMFTNCNQLSRIEATGFKVSFDISNCKLSSTRLNEIYTNLPTVTGQTITVTFNYGTASDDPTIATAKGWTVTG